MPFPQSVGQAFAGISEEETGAPSDETGAWDETGAPEETALSGRAELTAEEAVPAFPLPSASNGSIKPSNSVEQISPPTTRSSKTNKLA